MANWNNPTVTSTYANFVTEVNAKFTSLAKMDLPADTNVPTNAIQFEPTLRKFQQWNGTSWVDILPSSETWTPSYGAAGSMTYSSVTTDYAYYFKFGKWVFFRIKATGTTGGTANNYVSFTLPSSPLTAGANQFAAAVFDATLSGDISLGHAYNFSGTSVAVFRYNNTNWSLGTGRAIYVSGSYEVSA